MPGQGQPKESFRSRCCKWQWRSCASGRKQDQHSGSTGEEHRGRAGKRPPGHVRETVVLIVLSITAVLTAWCGFESSQWGGEMSIAFSEASGARIKAARQAGDANAARQADLSIWGVYLQARASATPRSQAT